jgi:hypothetical protein
MNRARRKKKAKFFGDRLAFAGLQNTQLSRRRNFFKTQTIAAINFQRGEMMASKESIEGLIPIRSDPREAMPTRPAALHLGRAEQTLRLWAMHDTGPISPFRVHGRLMWRTSDIRRVLGVVA